MKRKPYEKITLYNVISHSIFIEDNLNEHHFTIDKNDTYFDWSDDLETKLKEYKEIVLNYDDVGDSDGIEKILWCAEISTEIWNKYKNHDDIHEYISNEVDYDFKILKSKYYPWTEFLTDEEKKDFENDMEIYI